MTEAERSVLDASALLAYLWDEPGASIVGEALVRGGLISAANWAEVLSKLADFGEDPETASKDLETQGLLGGMLSIVDLTRADALAVSRLRPLTRTLGLSLGDRACLALGLRLNLPVLTADRQWTSLSLSVAVHVIRP